MNNNVSDAAIGLFATGGAIVFLIIYSVMIIAMSVFLLVGMWKIFVKAGKGGWESLIPGYNFWVMSEISCKNNIMFFVFIFIPFLNFVSYFAFLIGLAKCFGKGTGFIIFNCIFPFIGIPVLGLGKAQYNEAYKL